MANSSQSNVAKQKFDYLLILDFEATCDANKRIYPQEIIEFPCLKFNTKTLTVDSTFHHYVRPDVYPNLSTFCTELTGIVQNMVDDKPNLITVLEQFESWLIEENLTCGTNQNPNSSSWAFVTCGDWDLKTCLPKQMDYLGVSIPSYFKHWINLKIPFFECTKISRGRGMMNMLKILHLPHEGRHHSGIDDTKNIANIVKNLCEREIVFDITSL